MGDEDSVSAIQLWKLLKIVVFQRCSVKIPLLSDLLPQSLAAPVPAELGPVAEPASEPDVPVLTNSEECYFCGSRVYLLERISAEGKFFHRTCFTCTQCGITLRLGGYTFDPDTGNRGFGWDTFFSSRKLLDAALLSVI